VKMMEPTTSRVLELHPKGRSIVQEGESRSFNSAGRYRAARAGFNIYAESLFVI
jgi:hypothetical protein